MKQFLLFPFFSSVLCFNFNIRDVTEIQGNASREGSYFGYSLLLQKGKQGFSPTIIVGSPGHGPGGSGGSVHSCTKEGLCTKYRISASNANSFTGNFLGSVLDGGENAGESFVTCAPRVVKAKGENNFLNGWCFLQNNSSNTLGSYSEIKPLQDLSDISRFTFNTYSYYDFGFGEAGIDMKYLQNTKTLLMGAPGTKTWGGALVTYNVKTNRREIIPQKSQPVLVENFEYLGYQVTAARFNPNSNTLWYVLGAPRGSDLLGNVKIYSSQGILVSSLTGYEIGSYYGASILAADVNNDDRDDILVGAPMGSGSSWDEGYVYFYVRTENKLANPVKLIGSKKTGARFGTSIASLGDIDLDSYNDVAISAPTEDDGVGAVYIYRGSKTGIEPLYSQRLSPLDFYGDHRSVRGFGQGLSKGVDLDGNNHNDLAIGAYRSNQVFLLTTLAVIDYKLSLETNLTSVHAGGMVVQFCIYFSQRSQAQSLNSVKFNIKLQLDYRVEGDTDFDYTVDVPPSKRLCQSRTVVIRKSPLDITAFKLSLKSEILERNLVGKGENTIEKSIPYSHGCGDDDICQTSILLEAITNIPHITLGLNKEVIVNVSAENVNEPGYNCKLLMNFSNVLELRNSRDCDVENGTYICDFSRYLDKYIKKEVPFTFDLKLTTPTLDKVKFNFEINCLGVNSPPDANKRDLTLDVLLENSPYIQGSSTPENFYFNDENMEQDVQVTHKFQIRNFGPSPIGLDVFLAVPLINKDGIDIFDIDAKGSLNGIEVQCIPTNRTFKMENTYNATSLLTEPLNKTIVIDCFAENVDCLVLFCDGDYLYKSTEVAEYTLKITTNTKFLSSYYGSELLKKGILAYISSAYIFNSTNMVEGHTSTIIFTSKSKPIPMWVWIVAGIVGVLLLALLVFIFYKCHFFDRNYRDKLNDEKLMEQKMDDNIDNMDPVALHDLPSDSSQ